jgi:hypothetical protein
MDEPAKGLVEFANARLDEETNNAVNARNKAEGVWTGSHGGVSCPEGYIISVPEEAFLDRRIIDHLVHWQPQNALISLTLQRKIVFRLSQVIETLETADPESWQWEAAQAEIDGLTFAVEVLCVRFQDHPEYNHAWIPEG